MNLHFLRRRSGFTLIELLIVIVIIGVLATLGLVGYSKALQNSRNARRISNIKSISAAFEQYYTSNGGVYPGSSWSSLLSQSGSLRQTYFPSGVPTDPTFNTEYTPSISDSANYCVCAHLEPFDTSTKKAANSNGSCGTTGGTHYCLGAQQ